MGDSSSPLAIGVLRPEGSGGLSRRYNLPITSGASHHSKFVPPSAPSTKVHDMSSSQQQQQQFNPKYALAPPQYYQQQHYAAGNSHSSLPPYYGGNQSLTPPPPPPPYNQPAPYGSNQPLASPLYNQPAPYGGGGPSPAASGPPPPPGFYANVPSSPPPPYPNLPPGFMPRWQQPPPAAQHYNDDDDDNTDSEDDDDSDDDETEQHHLPMMIPSYLPGYPPKFGGPPPPPLLPPPPPMAFSKMGAPMPMYPAVAKQNIIPPPTTTTKQNIPTTIDGKPVQPLPQFEPSIDLKPPFSIATIGAARAGKTSMTIAQLAALRDNFDVVFCITESPDTRKRIQKLCLGVLVLHWNSGQTIARIFAAVEHMDTWPEEWPRLSIALLLDDLLSDDNIGKDRIWSKVFTRGHHNNLTTFALMHHTKLLKPDARGSYQFVMIGRTEDLELAWDCFFKGLIPLYKDFTMLYTHYVRKGSAIVANLKDSKLFVFETEHPNLLKPFTLGSRPVYIALQLFAKFLSPGDAIPGQIDGRGLDQNTAYQKYMSQYVDVTTGKPVTAATDAQNKGPTTQFHSGVNTVFAVQSRRQS